MRHLLAISFLAFACSCAGKTRLDCVEICREKGLRFEEVVTAVKGYDPSVQQLETIDACRCR